MTFVPTFVGGDMSLLVRHYLHGVRLVGEKALALGSDFDGCTEPVVPDASYFPEFAKALRREGVSPPAIRALFHGNLLRYFRQVLSP